MKTHWVRARVSPRSRHGRLRRRFDLEESDRRPALRAVPAAATAPHTDRGHQLLWLQDAVGNSAVARTIASHGQQPAPALAVQRKAGPAIPEGAIPSSKLRKTGTAAQTQFMKKVYEAQILKSVRDPTKQFSKGLEDDEKAEVESGHELRKDVVSDAQGLLAAARSALAEAKRKGDGEAAKTVTSIGIASAYRPLIRDFSAWQTAFKTRYDNTTDERAALPGGEHGAAAVALMVKGLYDSKAIPGFSRHSKGLAIDFTTRQGKWNFGPSGSQADGWKKTWLFGWLQRHAADYGFEPYEKEPWHWAHKDPKAAEGEETGKAGAEAAAAAAVTAAEAAAKRAQASP